MLGCDRVIDYRQEGLRDVPGRQYPQGLDIAFDTVGGDIVGAFVDHVAMGGRVIASGHASDFDQPELPVAAVAIDRRQDWKSASIRALQMTAFTKYFAEGVRRILEAYSKGEIRPVPDRTRFRGLEAVADAVEYVLSGRSAGQVIVDLQAGK